MRAIILLRSVASLSRDNNGDVTSSVVESNDSSSVEHCKVTSVLLLLPNHFRSFSDTFRIGPGVLPANFQTLGFMMIKIDGFLSYLAQNDS